MHHCETNLNKKNFFWWGMPPSQTPSRHFRHSRHSLLCPTHFLLPSGAYALLSPNSLPSLPVFPSSFTRLSPPHVNFPLPSLISLSWPTLSTEWVAQIERNHFTFFADHTDGRAYAMLQCCVRRRLSSVRITECITAKWCVLREQKLLFTASL